MGSRKRKQINSIGHTLERSFNAPARDILDAIRSGFRAQVDVKGKLAELYLYRQFKALQQQGHISELVWSDKDGDPDFFLQYMEHRLSVQCKNVRSGEQYKTGREKANSRLNCRRHGAASIQERGRKHDTIGQMNSK